MLRSGPLAAMALAMASAAHPAGAPGASLLIGADGQLTFSVAGDTVRRNSTPIFAEERALCASLTKASREMTIRSDAKTPYIIFMNAANFLEDCGVQSLRVTGPAKNLAGKAIDVRVVMGYTPAPPPLCIPFAGGQCPPPPKPKLPTYLSLRGDGLIRVSLDTGGVLAKLDDLRADVATSLGTAPPTQTQVLIRAEADATYAGFSEMLGQLNRDGYTNLVLLNENLRP
jgi:biopolymer transport protein ExbD